MKKLGGIGMIIDSSSLVIIFEGKKDTGKKLLTKIKDLVDREAPLEVLTPASSFLRAISLIDPDTKVKNIQKMLSVMKIYPSFADHKNKESCMDEILVLAKSVSDRAGRKEERYKQASALARKVFTDHHGDKRKAELWVCHRIMPNENYRFSKAKCYKCKADISYDPKMSNHMTKKAKKICRECITSDKKYLKRMSDDEKRILGVIDDK